MLNLSLTTELLVNSEKISVNGCRLKVYHKKLVEKATSVVFYGCIFLKGLLGRIRAPTYYVAPGGVPRHFCEEQAWFVFDIHLNGKFWAAALDQIGRNM